MNKYIWPGAVLFVASLILSMPTFAQQTDDTATTTETTASTPTKSGYTEGGTLEGGDSVTQDLAADDQDLGSVLRFPRFENFFAP